MKTFEEMSYHPKAEKLVEILVNRTMNDNPLFFRVVVGYYFCKLAALMRTMISTNDLGIIPINMYALNLSPSGTGKGKSTGMLDREVIHRFKKRFIEETFPAMAEQHLPKLSLERAIRRKSDPDTEALKTQKEFEGLGPVMFDFSEATTAATKQLRHKLLMAQAGSVNLEIDEIGTKLIGQGEVLDTFLELFDVGRVKSSLRKNTSDNLRSEDIDGSTPTNLLMFGAPEALLNGDVQEQKLYGMLEMGYGRRCFFGYARAVNKITGLTAEQAYELLIKQDNLQFLEDMADELERLADVVNANKHIVVSREVSILLHEYKLQCEAIAAALPEHDSIRKHELNHRYFKALKLAGAYAWVDDSPELTEDHLYYAIKLAEESGEAFGKLLSRDRPWVKLAKYLANVGKEVTHADLVEDLPFYPQSETKRREILTLASAWGYKNNVLVKKSFEDGIEFLRGESLEVTDLQQMTVAYSTDITTGYLNEIVPWGKLSVLTQQPGFHWLNHHVTDGYRNEENAIPGFNMVVIDVDRGPTLEMAKNLLQGRMALYYVTKSHSAAQHRFRILLPMNYKLYMDAADFKQFYKNIEAWLPFEVDESCSHRSKKWLAHPGYFEYTDGELLDVLPFIPKTSKADEQQKRILEQRNLDNLERWVLNNTGDGNRNNMLHRYAMILLDAGLSSAAIEAKLLSLNEKLPDKLSDSEIKTSVMITVNRRVTKMAA